jgi:hypothetical protein
MPFKIAATHAARKHYKKEVSRTATRPVPGRSARELRAAVETFLKASKQLTLLEPSEEILVLSAANFILDALDGRLKFPEPRRKSLNSKKRPREVPAARDDPVRGPLPAGDDAGNRPSNFQSASTGVTGDWLRSMASHPCL